MTDTSITDKYIVVGNPIAQSKSPNIHMLFAKQTKQNLIYDRLLVDVSDFDRAIKVFFEEGGKGLNITAPFKEDAFNFADELTERAQLAGAVNTLALTDSGQVLGDTTDGLGLVADIRRLGWQIQNARILILGAGGAVRGVVQPILESKPASLTIANRTVSKAQDITDIYTSYGPVTASGLIDLNNTKFDIIINGSSAGLSGQLPDVSADIFGTQPKVYDMSYASGLTPFLRWAKDEGVENYSDGMGMLVGQAAEAFAIWRGVRPEVEPVIHLLKAE